MNDPFGDSGDGRMEQLLMRLRLAFACRDAMLLKHVDKGCEVVSLTDVGVCAVDAKALEV